MLRLTPAVLLCMLIALWPAHAVAQTGANTLSGEIILKLRPGYTLTSDARVGGAPTTDHLLRRFGASAAVLLGIGSDTYRLYVNPNIDPQAIATRLSVAPGVVYAEPNRRRNALLIPNDTLISQQWALNDIHAFDAWNLTIGGTITIALLDTGVSPTHPDLKNKLLPGYDFYNVDSDPSDDDGHGTYTAGVAAANAGNGTGIAGICWGCKILPVKVLDHHGQGDDATIAAGIRYAVDQGARIISMSLGGPEDTQVLRDAIAYAHDRNVLIVAASGNGQAEGNLPNYPAAYPSVLAVSATNANDNVTGFSTTGNFVDIAAPGFGVWSTLWNRTEGDTYGSANGTSAACPHVAGAAALLLTMRPDLTADQMAELLMASADDQGVPGKDPEYGYGRLNLLQALQSLNRPDLLQQSRIQGTVRSAAPEQVLVTLNTGQQTRPDAAGFFSFDSLPAGSYTVTVQSPSGAPLVRQASLTGTALSVAMLNFASGLDAAPFFQPVAPAGLQATFFPQTQHSLRGAFRDYWQANGGLPIFGYPISEEFVERSDDGRDYIVQYFERHRLEFHPDKPAPYHVQLTRLGDLILQENGRAWFAFPKGRETPGCIFFPETGHTLCGAILRYWQAHGLEFDGRRGKSIAENLALFGMPLSEPQLETLPDGRTYVVQWFERARFEDHGPQGVLLGLLGNELAIARGWR